MSPKSFSVEFSTKAVKDLKSISSKDQAIILNKTKLLYERPFTWKNTIKKIRGMRFPCYRLRVDGKNDSYRLFYGIADKSVLIIRIVSKKKADRIIKAMR